MEAAPSLSLVFPAWNEEGYAERAVRLAVEVLAEITPDFEVLVVDDASTDGTSRILADLARELPRLRILTHDENRTLGATLRTGFSATTKDVVVYSDIDLPFDLREIGRALRLMGDLEADLVCAFRLDRTSEGLRRIAYSQVYNLLVRTLFDVGIKDVNFGFKVIRRSVLEAIELESEGSFIDAELVVKAIRRGFRVIQLGVDFFPRTRGESTLSSPSTIARILVDLVRLYPRIQRPAVVRRPVRAPADVRTLHPDARPRAAAK